MRRKQEARPGRSSSGPSACPYSRASESLFTELPRAGVLGNPYAAGRIGIRDPHRRWGYRGVLRVEAHTPCNALGWIFTTAPASALPIEVYQVYSVPRHEDCPAHVRALVHNLVSNPEFVYVL